MLFAYQTLANFQNEDCVVESFGYLMELAEAESRLFRAHLPALVDFVATIARNDTLESSK